MTTNILPVGIKIKKLREKYQLNQDDIVGTELTRNLISQIEHGKANLTKSTAELIIRNTKKILNRRSIPLDPKYSVDYLLETEESQAKTVLTVYIKELKEVSVYKGNSSFAECLEKIETLLSQWEFGDLKIEVCEIAGDYYANNNEYLKAYIYYENVKYLIACQTDMSRVISVFRKLSTIYVYNGKYKEGVNTCKYALSRFKMDNAYKAIFMFNMSMYYNYLKEYEKSLDVILESESHIKQAFPDRINDLLLLKASSLHGVKHYADALRTYTEILNNAEKDDYNRLCVYYNNMAEIYCSMGNTDTAKNYVQTVNSYLVKVSDDFKYLPQIYLGLGRVYIMLKEQDKGLKLLLKALETSKSFKYHSVTKDIINEFTGFNNEVTGIDLKEEFVILTQIMGFIDNKLVYNIMEYFSRLNKNDELISICKFCKKMA
ncbi:helix-turn-helix domain-containing protein [Clostridium felsineum]|uniref:helix-turn-helix domain-containing protein n=1 Tax=Clostridium felsineum TaxID=36839 RepID=UPI00098C51A3|nr:helix-turn-helix domain-containing protein [Clostridium felsineum]URZ18330.1 hypothetical protein CLFE_044000 [Clostridium felsineum DSM 794]